MDILLWVAVGVWLVLSTVVVGGIYFMESLGFTELDMTPPGYVGLFLGWPFLMLGAGLTALLTPPRGHRSA